MPNPQLPNLTFPTIEYGRLENTIDLRILLYQVSTSMRSKQVFNLIDQGILDQPILERLELVKKLHEEINGNLVGGGSRYAVVNSIRNLRNFFEWADKNGHKLDLTNVEATFGHWTDHLYQRHWMDSNVSAETLYKQASIIATLLDKVLDRRTKLIRQIRLHNQLGSNAAHSNQTDKQNLEVAFKFGHLLLDICDGLPMESINATLPVRIPLRTGEVIEEWSGLKCPEKLKPPKDRHDANRAKRLRKKWEADTSIRTRYPIVNLRIHAELMVFISQTSMNLEQTFSITNDRFHYTSHLDGYQVRRYKNRRSGEVEFFIYSEYKVIFERYLSWRCTMFPDDPEGLLFPLIRKGGRRKDKPPTFERLKKICNKVCIKFIGPRELRKTRVNWLLRQSQDPKITAEMAQHTQETLLGTYQQPNPQVAMVEITRFHSRSDPTIAPPGPGWCISPTPIAMPDIPKDATQPDCTNAAGCLFCWQQRDIDSEDHVWSMASFRYLKSLELANYRPCHGRKATPVAQPAAAAVERLTAKLKFFETSSEVRGLWVREALARVTEGDYHPFWDGFIQLQELRP